MKGNGVKFVSVYDGRGRLLVNLSEASKILRIDEPDRDDVVVTKNGEMFTCLSKDGAVDLEACVVDL